MASDWLVWQLADSAFPAGALAHSCGLEAAVQHQVVTDSESLAAFVRMVMKQLHCGVGVFVGLAWNDQSQFEIHDADCDLFLNSAVANRASRAQGLAFLATAAQTYVDSDLKNQAANIRQQKSPTHFAPVFGLVGRSLGIERDETMRLFSFVTARSVFSSAVRLGVVGPLEAQRMQAALSIERTTPSPGTPGEGGGEGDFELRKTLDDRNHPYPTVPELIEDRERGLGAIQISPFLDLLQSTQDRLYSRLFQS